MSAIDTLAQTQTRHLEEDRSLEDARTTEAAAVANTAGELSGQIETRLKTAQGLTSQIQNRKIAVTRFDLPAPSTTARGERFAASDAAKNRLDAVRSAIPRVEERLENDLQAIDGLRKARAQALRRLQTMIAAAVVLAVVFAGIVLDRLSKAQTAYDAAVAALSRGDVNAFDQKVTEAARLIPAYRAVEAASLRSIWQARESQYQVVVAALQRNDFVTFDKEVTALKVLSPEYRKAEVATMVKTKADAITEVQYQRAVTAFKQDDLTAFDGELAALKALNPEYRRAEVAAMQTAKSNSISETHFQALAAALRRNDLKVFDAEIAALRSVDGEYRKAETDSYQSWRASGLDLSQVRLEMGRVSKRGEALTIIAPINLDLVFVPGGRFTMGSDPQKDRNASGSEMPQHDVTLAQFWVGKTEITNDQYAVYARANGVLFSFSTNRGSFPANVNWPDAQSFAGWLSSETGMVVRLPTEEEWEKACRGSDGQIYPWGNNYDSLRFNSSVGDADRFTAVGTFSPRGDSPYGAADMVGNASEWTSSSATWNYESNANPILNFRILRGGRFDQYSERVRCAGRDGGNPNERDNYRLSFGFRIVVSKLNY